MKKTITGVVALLAGAFVAHSQGTVSMANAYNSTHTYVYISYNGTKLGGSTGATAGSPTADVGNGAEWTVALYGYAGSSDSSSQLQECTVAGGGFATATLADGNTDGNPGTWASTVVAQIPGTTGSGQTATVQLEAWYNDGGTITSYSAATIRGESALANILSTGGVPVGGGPSATAPTLPMTSLGNFSVVPTPEPSTVALGVMGASAFLLRLRRKK
jgi:hypothetical protein